MNANPFDPPGYHDPGRRGILATLHKLVDRPIRYMWADYTGRQVAWFFLGGVSFFVYFAFLRIRDFSDLGKSAWAEWIYPVLFIVEANTKFGIEATCWFSVFLWLTIPAFSIAYLYDRFIPSLQRADNDCDEPE